ncbi:MAG: molecular chaperone [Nostoc sp. NOS(2021)]|uniref:fimbrial biogenesis chaperone n=1 Tax=Nostoc sp. NOS(2021) TaxID=2815407 RepID=UPI0025F62D21|nr:fimbria/pilus periplasmic chaperone [Nostoc sp. NOS(2021)]MBN3893924.1 molecular chaperone [Nostoc sp. NOS(2021)]
MLSKSRNIALGLMGVLALGMPPATALNIGVTPSRIEVEINSSKMRTQSIRVLNASSEPIEVKAVVRSWVMSEDNKLQEVAPTEQSLEQWIVFTPSRFTIPAHGAQTLRFAIRPKVQPKPGEHRTVIYFEEIPSNSSQSKGVRIIGRLGVVIYGYVGKIQRIGVINSVTVETKPKAINAVFDISNQGNGYIRLNGQYAIWPVAKYPGAEATKPVANFGKPEAKIPEFVLDSGSLPSSPVLPDNRRQLRLPITKNLPPGNYVLDINGDLSGVPIDKGIPFTVPAVNNNLRQSKPTSQKLTNYLRNR